jgi:ribosomal protein S18 acetylase RimI-like enzyme
MSSNLDIQTRPATLRDAKAIAELHVNTWQVAYAGLVPDDYLKAMSVEKQQALWREAIQYSEPQVVVALDGNAIVGFAGYDRSRDPKTKPTNGEIWAMYAAPDYWDEGVGLALWDACREGLLDEGCLDVSLWVLIRNERAMRFYDLAGFKREMNTAKTVPMGSGKVEEIRLKRSLN